MILDHADAASYQRRGARRRKEPTMHRTALRMAAALGLALLLAGCDKCGNFNLYVPGAPPPAACTDVKPRG